MPRTDPLTTKEAAAMLRVSVATVNRWADTGKLEHLQKFPGRTGPRLFDGNVVARFAADRRAAMQAVTPAAAAS